MWEEAPEGMCYLADGSGSKISGDDFPLSLREGDGGPMTIPWTLSNYIKMSGASYPRRVRLYCVNIHGVSDGRRILIPCKIMQGVIFIVGILLSDRTWK